MDAGAFTLSGLLTDIGPVRGDDGNDWAQGSGPLFAPGAQIEAHLEGAEVPAFDATIDMPPRVLDIQPSPGSVPRGEDLHFSPFRRPPIAEPSGHHGAMITSS